MDSFEEWKEVVRQHYELKSTATIYDFFFYLNKAVDRNKQAVKQMKKFKKANG